MWYYYVRKIKKNKVLCDAVADKLLVETENLGY